MECFEIMEKWQRKTAFCQRRKVVSYYTSTDTAGARKFGIFHAPALW
jgi:hypothetical protein